MSNTKSIKHDSIAAALVAAQRNFAPALKKETNPHFRSRYADLASCVDAVVHALNDEGIFLHQRTHVAENGITIETIFLHETGQELSGGMFHVPVSKLDAQGYGSALTYARRYSLLTATSVAATDDDDDGNAASKTITQEQVDNIVALAAKVGSNLKNIAEFYKVKSIEKLPAAAYSSLISSLEKKKVQA